MGRKRRGGPGRAKRKARRRARRLEANCWRTRGSREERGGERAGVDAWLAEATARSGTNGDRGCAYSEAWGRGRSEPRERKGTHGAISSAARRRGGAARRARSRSIPTAFAPRGRGAEAPAFEMGPEGRVAAAGCRRGRGARALGGARVSRVVDPGLGGLVKGPCWGRGPMGASSRRGRETEGVGWGMEEAGDRGVPLVGMRSKGSRI